MIQIAAVCTYQMVHMYNHMYVLIYLSLYLCALCVSICVCVFSGGKFEKKKGVANIVRKKRSL